MKTNLLATWYHVLYHPPPTAVEFLPINTVFVFFAKICMFWYNKIFEFKYYFVNNRRN